MVTRLSLPPPYPPLSPAISLLPSSPTSLGALGTFVIVRPNCLLSPMLSCLTPTLIASTSGSSDGVPGRLAASRKRSLSHLHSQSRSGNQSAAESGAFLSLSLSKALSFSPHFSLSCPPRSPSTSASPPYLYPNTHSLSPPYLLPSPASSPPLPSHPPPLWLVLTSGCSL